MPTLDLGCGGMKRGDVGIDVVPWPGVDHVVALGFEEIPYPDDTFDGAWMVHAIEHIPFVVFTTYGQRAYPMVHLLREVHRVLRPGATWNILTLEFPDPRCFEDPTHVSVWTRSTIHHFVGARDSEVGNKNDEMAKLRVPFELVRSGPTPEGLLEIILRKAAR